MPDALTQDRAHVRRRQNHLLIEWQDAQRPALNRYVAGVLATLTAMEEVRASFMFARDITRHDAYAVDVAGAAIDFIEDTTGAIGKRLDEEGGDPDDIAIEYLELRQAHAKLKARSDARVTP